MAQMHEMCLAKYRFAILDNAFLTHSPGIKRRKNKVTLEYEKWRAPFVKANKRIYKEIVKELRKKYPGKTRCKERL